MRRALALARRGLGETNPNPMVGCVVVQQGRVVGEGFHARAGGPHAEVVALQEAGAAARGATLYVTLEPCAHQGRTPPCAPLVAAAGVRRVVVAMRDPDPRVNGRGLRLLRRARIAVTAGVGETEARLLNERFVTAAEKRRPFVLLKAAITLDGRIATADRDSKWITSLAQRREARRLRRRFDATLVGIGTARADDPLLLPEPRTRRPFHRVVLDSRLRIPLGGRLVKTARQSPLIVVTTAAAPASQRRRLEAVSVSVIVVPARAGRVDLGSALGALYRAGITSLMVEGGSEVLGAFAARRLFDQIALFRAPLLLCGRGSLGAFGGENPRRIAEAQPLRREESGSPHFELWYPR